MPWTDRQTDARSYTNEKYKTYLYNQMNINLDKFQLFSFRFVKTDTKTMNTKSAEKGGEEEMWYKGLVIILR